MTTTLPAPRIPLNTPEDLLDKLKLDYKELDNGRAEYKAFNFVVTAYHLFEDWIKKSPKSDLRLKKPRKRCENLPANARKLFDVLRDITNASKHFQLNEKSRNKQIVTDVSTPQIRDMHSFYNNRPVLYVTVEDACPSLSELACLTLECITWILQGDSDVFPPELIDRLDHVFRPLM